MSSDDFIGIFSSKDPLGRDSRWYIGHGRMINIETVIEEEDWKKRIMKDNKGYPTRESALISAHNLIRQENENPFTTGVEYGVLEL